MRQIPEIAEPEGLTKTHVFAAALSLALLVGAGFGLAIGHFLPANATKSASLPVEPLVRSAGPRPQILSPSGAAPAAGYAVLPSALRSSAHLPTGGTRAPSRPPSLSVADALDLPLEEALTSVRQYPVAVASASPLNMTDVGNRAGEGAQRPQIAVVLDDLGLDEASTRRAIALPAAVTLSFLPYGKAAPGLAEEARARGHEIMAHIPMQPEGPEDPGPNALRVDLPADDISARLAVQLDKFPGAIGFNNHMGSRFTSDVRALLPVMREARARGLIFLDSRTTANSLAAKIALASGTETLTRDVFLDHASGPDGLLSQLAELERIAHMSGSAIGIAHPHALTLDVLDVWSRGLEAKGFELVPITVLARGKRENGLLAASGL
ncbi:MAG: divergent polysaccharide deacetylase family protein [Parvibaculum sp.]